MVHKWIKPALFTGLALLLFFAFKAIRFERLYYFYNDMYAFLQSSSSWLDGRPVLYENVWGYDDRIHNNYLLLLFGPVFYYLGFYGTLLIMLLLFGLSYGLVVRQLALRSPAPWIGWAVLLVSLLGPVWFWFNEHAGIGWHPELVYLPFSLLLTLALVLSSWRWFAVVALLIVSVKEDGALLGGSLHLMWLGLSFLSANPTSSLGKILSRENRQRSLLWKAIGGWTFVFVVGMVWLSLKNNVAQPEPRLRKALETIGSASSDFWPSMAGLLLNMGLLLLPTLLLWGYLTYRLRIRQWGNLLLLYSIGLLALTISNAVQGATYFADNPYFEQVSITWPPRFVLVFAFTVCFLVMTLLRWSGPMNQLRPAPTWQPAFLVGGLILLQFPIVEKARPDFRFKQVIYYTLRHPFDPDKLRLLPQTDVAFIRRLAALIPPRSNVFVFDYLIPFYHKHYLLWPTDKQWKNADLAILPLDDFQGLSKRLPRIMNGPYQSVALSAYRIYYTPAFSPFVEQAKAGLDPMSVLNPPQQ